MDGGLLDRDTGITETIENVLSPNFQKRSMPLTDYQLLFAAVVGLCTFAAGVFVNRPKIARAANLGGAVVENLRQYDAAIADGTITDAETMAIGRATIEIYTSGKDLKDALTL
jgi:hypothetical protein